jgi:hypothetical protein
MYAKPSQSLRGATVVIKRKVTRKKTLANRRNARKSTGPRTDGGKSVSRFNALKFGFFAKDVVIREVDGEDASGNFEAFIEELREELQPVGIFETTLVGKIAEGFWRLRRANRAEGGSIRILGFWDRSLELSEKSPARELMRSVDDQRQCLSRLIAMKEQIVRTGTLPRNTFLQILPVVQPQQKPETYAASEEQAESEVAIDDGFKKALDDKITSFQTSVSQVDLRLAERNWDLIRQGGLPPLEEGEKISRYRNRAQKEIDWALQRLFQLQGRRRGRS